MWWHKARTLDVGLSSQFVYIADPAQPRQLRLPCPQLPGEEGGAPWRAPVQVLADWLAAQQGLACALRIVLSGRFVRWQLLPWRDELSAPGERRSLADLRFREMFGSLAQAWQVALAQLPPGRMAPACAVDQELLQALQAAVSGVGGDADADASSGVRLARVAPYFSLAFDHWRSRIRGPGAWFVLLESDGVSFGLLQDGDWRCLHSQRLDGDWRAVLPALLVQAGMAAGLGPQPLPLYLAGDLAQPPLPLALDSAGTRLLAPDWCSPAAYPRGLVAAPGLRLALGL